MVKKLTKEVRRHAARTSKRRTWEITEDEEQILRQATKHLILEHGGLLVATAIRQERVKGSKRWIIIVTLRFPTGHEGYIGDLLYDGKVFTFLTSTEVRQARARQIEADPNLRREWDEYRAATLPARKAQHLRTGVS